MEEKEEWRDVVGFEGYYKVSNLGRIMSLHKHTKLSKDGGAILKQAHNSAGYRIVILYGQNRRITKTVHKIVAKAFVPNPHNYDVINHKDECKTNNRADNLEWCTYQYNNTYGSARTRSALKQGNPVAQMNCYGDVIAKYRNMRVAVDILGLGSTNVIGEAIRSNGTGGGYMWKYIDLTEFEGCDESSIRNCS